MRIADLCSREVVTVEPKASLREAALAMRNAHVGALVIVERAGGVTRPVGILTDRDIVVAVMAVPAARPESIRVCDAMSAPPALARDAEKGALVGIVTAQDILELYSADLGAMAEGLHLARRRERSERKRIEIP